LFVLGSCFNRKWGEGKFMAKPVVIVVGADKGGVGKTTVARTLLDYFSANHIASRAFIPNPRAVR
jgi:2-phosphoglycerate kinase